ncbi:MAG: hypothetical protein IKS90_05070 [Clostridia bacterium]|nr:hypothetical protein [Clostridia bacterium]
MKKSRIFISIVLATLMFGTLFSAACTPANAPAQQETVSPTPVLSDPVEAATIPPDPTIVPEEASTTRVLTIGSGSHRGMHLFQYDINNSFRETVDKELVGDKKTIEFAGKKFELVYRTTITAPMTLGTAYEYDIIGGRTGFEFARFLPDGTLIDLSTESFGLGTVSIPKNAKGEDVRDAVAEALKEEALKSGIDFSDFEYCDIRLPEVYEDGTMSSYQFYWYNKLNGIKIYSGVMVFVDGYGKIESVSLGAGLGKYYSSVPNDVSIEKYVPDVEKKVREFFGHTLVDFKIWSDPRPMIACLNGEPCLWYTVSVKYIHDDGQPWDEAIEIAVMLCP